MTIRQGAFKGAPLFLKGALHVHTTRSDGSTTPEETLERYQELGYQFVALTDHRYYNYNNYGENNLTIIPGMEMDASFVGENQDGVHCFHTVVIGPEKNNGFEQDERLPSGKLRVPQDIQPDLDSYHQKNNMTIYCHPEWSNTPVHEYEHLEGNFAMELYNTGCALENEMDTDNGIYWDYLLHEGKKIYGVATDDGHTYNQIGKGYVMVNAENNVDSILNALKEGNFYASCGPEIYDFYVEEGEVHIRCSDVQKIAFCYGRYPTKIIRRTSLPLSEAMYQYPKSFSYIRAVVTDKEGNKAWTNPIFLEKEE